MISVDTASDDRGEPVVGGTILSDAGERDKCSIDAATPDAVRVRRWRMTRIGNTTVLADQTLTYDVADRHVKTVLTDGTTITYTLDASGRTVARTVTGSPTSSENGTIRYLAGGGIADENGAVQQWVVSLPGGGEPHLDVGDDTQRWGFLNLHGDVIVTTDAAGTRQSSTGNFYRWLWH